MPTQDRGQDPLQVKQPDDWHDLMVTIAWRIHQDHDLNHIFQECTQRVARLLGCDQVWLFLKTGKGYLEAVATAPATTPVWRIPPAEGDSPWYGAFQQTGYIAIEHSAASVAPPGLGALLRAFPNHALLLVAVPGDRYPQGLLAAIRPNTQHPWEATEVSAMRGLVLQLSLALRVNESRAAKTHRAELADTIQRSDGNHRQAELLAVQRQVLELLTEDVPLDDQLQRLAVILEGQYRQMLISIMLMTGGQLHHGAGPGLPSPFLQATSALRIAEGTISCATAAHRRELVITADIREDPLWRRWRDIANEAGIRACWSMPLLSRRRELLGTLSMYFRRPRTPNPADMEFLRVAASLAGLAIARKHTETALRISKADNRALIQAIPDLIIHMHGDGRHLDFLSGGGVKILNREASMKPGATVYDVLPRHLADLRMQHTRLALSTGEVQFYEYQIEIEGETRFEETRVIPYRDDEVLLVIRDISDLKRYEKDLVSVNQQLEARLADLNRRNTEMALLSEMGDFLQACVSVEEAYAALSGLLKPMFPGCGGALFVIATSRARMEPVTHWALPQQATGFIRPAECWALRRGRIHYLDPHRPELRCAHALAEPTTAASVCIPMIAQGESLGLFYLAAPTAELLDTNIQQLARTAAEQIALAIANLQLRQTLFQQSIRDPLTGLYNRRYLEESLNREVTRAQRHQQSIGIIMLDVDHFKRFNDTYGHDVGDRVLQAVSYLLRDRVRGSDLVCRYGGEEMTLVLPGSSTNETLARAEAIRREIARLEVPHHGRSLMGITASLGVASYPQHGGSGAEVVQAADSALYRAKAAGRDRVMVAS